MLFIVFVGSIASGKTTTAHVLRRMLARNGITVRYVHVNITHGLAYLLTRILFKMLRYKYISNYYLSLRYNNPRLFCRILWILMLLDTLYIPVKSLLSTDLYKFYESVNKKMYVFILDEYYVNAIVDYLYFTSGLCSELSKSPVVKIITKLFYIIALGVVHKTVRDNESLIVRISADLRVSLIGWLRRENIRVFDLKHILFRDVGTKVILQQVREYGVKVQNIQFHGNLSEGLLKAIYMTRCLINGNM